MCHPGCIIAQYRQRLTTQHKVRSDDGNTHQGKQEGPGGGGEGGGREDRRAEDLCSEALMPGSSTSLKRGAAWRGGLSAQPAQSLAGERAGDKRDKGERGEGVHGDIRFANCTLCAALLVTLVSPGGGQQLLSTRRTSSPAISTLPGVQRDTNFPCKAAVLQEPCSGCVKDAYASLHPC